MKTELVKQKQKKFQFRPNVKIVAGAFAFMIPFTLMLAIFIGNGIFPFGDRSFLVSDMYHQYMPFFQEFVNRIKAGDGISYSWNVGMGSNFLALYVYYLASPLNWLAFLFPQEYLADFMSYLVIVKLGAAGVAAFLWLRSKGREESEIRKDMLAVFVSVFYAFSGYIAAYNWNIMWLDCVVLLPIILLGLERLMKEGKAGLYCFSLALCIYTNFYISIMICIFLVLYFFFLYTTEKKQFWMIPKFAGASLLAGGLAAILLVPVVYALLATDFGETVFPETWKSYFSVLDILARHCVGIATEKGLDHWPNIYCGSAVFFLIPLYCVNDRIPMKKKFGMMGLLMVFLLSFGTNILDFLWHGLNYPDSLPGRQSFIYILLVLVMCYETLVKIEGVSPKAIMKAYLLAAAALLCVQKFVECDDFKTCEWLITLGFATVFARLVYLYRTRNTKKIYVLISMAALVFVMVEAACNMAWTSVGTVSRSEYFDQQENYTELYHRYSMNSDTFERFEKLDRRTKNDGILASYPTASLFSSTMNSDVMAFYKRFGMRHSKVFYCYDGATAFSSALLNVGYLFGDSDEYENDLLQLVDQMDKVYLYETKYKLPFGYVAPAGFDLPEEMDDHGITIQNEIVNRLGIDGLLLKKVSSQSSGNDIVFTPQKSGIYYGCVMASGTTKITAVGGTPSEQKFRDLKKGSLLYLGYLDADQTITLTNGDEEDSTPKISVYMYRLDLKLLEEALEVLGQKHMTNVKIDNTKVTGELVLEEAGRLIVSIPYEKGWKALVNDQETPITAFGEAFLALDLEAGEYRIEFDYEPAGKKEGILLSLMSLGILAIIAAVIWLLKKRKKTAGVQERKNDEGNQNESVTNAVTGADKSAAEALTEERPTKEEPTAEKVTAESNKEE